MEYQGGTILDINCVSIGKEPYDDGYISHVTNFRFELMLQHSVICIRGRVGDMGGQSYIFLIEFAGR